ncbi:MAG: hypothetical protein MJE66_12480 [Proteobacteria bacterium]|nr:hypothetical protein [Pseudomonadota bacterium]
MGRTCVLASLALWASAGLALAAPSDGKPPQPTMAAIFETLRVVLPASLDAESFAAPERQAAIGAALAQLEHLAGDLESHGRAREAGFGYLSRTLAQDAAEISRRYRSGQFEGARFLYHQNLETCVTCHSRLPAARDFGLGRGLVASIDTDALPPRQRARLEVVTRQFAAALGTYERWFADPAARPEQIDRTGAYYRYLDVCLRIEGDPARALRTFEALAARKDLSASLRRDVDAWVRSLRGLEARPVDTPALARARDLLARGRALSASPHDAASLVYDIEASFTLQHFVDAASEPSEAVSEAYYLLGTIEARLWRSPWLSQAEPFLEASIRMAPGAAHAPRAYAALEELTLLGYSGSAGLQLPPDVERRLADLWASVHAHHPTLQPKGWSAPES